MERASYEKISIDDPSFPVWVLENEKATRQQLCPLHWHEYLELHYIFEGTLEVQVGQSVHRLQAGDLIVINANEAHSSRCLGQLRERILIFRTEDLCEPLSSFRFQRIISQNPQADSCFAAFESEYRKQDFGFEIACKGILLQLLVHLSRNFLLTPSSNLDYQRHSRQLQRFQPVLEYIALHYAEPIAPERLAKLIFLSTDRFNHLFKETMGIPLRRYINEIRLHSARDWLEKGQCSPTEAALHTGFTDYNHFGRLFRNAFGCTPSQISKTAK